MHGEQVTMDGSTYDSGIVKLPENMGRIGAREVGNDPIEIKNIKLRYYTYLRGIGAWFWDTREGENLKDIYVKDGPLEGCYINEGLLDEDGEIFIPYEMTVKLGVTTFKKIDWHRYEAVHVDRGGYKVRELRYVPKQDELP